MQQIPIQAVPSQQLSVVLAGQNCQIAIYQKPQALFFDLNVNGTNVAIGIQAHDAVILNPFNYANFSGNLMFIDTQGSDDPTYSYLGTRFVLIYLTEAEYGQLI